MVKLKDGVRLQAAAKTLGIGVATLKELLAERGVTDLSPNSKLDIRSLELIKEKFEQVEIQPSSPAQPKPEVAEGKAPAENAPEPASPEPAPETPPAAVEPPPAKPKRKPKVATEPTPAEAAAKAPKTTKAKPKATGAEKPPAPSPAAAPPEPQPAPEEPKVEALVAPEPAPAPVVEEEKPKKEEKVEQPAAPAEELMQTEREKEILDRDPGLTVVGHIDLDAINEGPRRGKSKATKGKKSAAASVSEPPAKPETPVEKPQEADAAAPVVEAQPVEEAPKDIQDTPKDAPADAPKDATNDVPAEPTEELFRASVEKLSGPTVVGKIDLSTVKDRRGRKPEASASPTGGVQKRRQRKRADGTVAGGSQPGGASQRQSEKRRGAKGKTSGKKANDRAEISREEIEEKLKQTQERLASKRSNTLAKGAKYRKEKRQQAELQREEQMERAERESRIIQVSEFVSVNELAGIMDVQPNQVIEACMNLGLMVGINQRLDAETLTLVADEFGFKLDFVGIDVESSSKEADAPEDLKPRPPVFTVLGHVDHGKTTLVDTIRKTNVTASEAGGITQHLSAYSFTTAEGRQITFIDTPGHAAYTAMRSRGSKLADVAIIMVSAEDGLMPQTKEAINAVANSGAKMVFAINKIDSPKADPDRAKKELADFNYLVEEWGGKYQSQDISAKFNKNVDLLLDKVLLEADLLELQANPNKRAEGVVLESMVDKGRGHCAVVLVQAGTLRKGDSIVSGGFYGRVKAILSDSGQDVKEAGPSSPVMVVGLNGAPQAGDSFQVVENDKEARQIAAKVSTIRRQVELRARKHTTLDEIGRRIAIGNFKELNLIVKGDVDGSVEALSGSLAALSTEEIQVNIISRGVGQITETDVNLASSSDAIILGFQVRPSVTARRLAEAEQIDIRLYSVIYDAIEELKSAMEGMLSPEVKEEVSGTAEVMETFRISKVGTIAGCMVREGKIQKSNKVRIIRDGIVIYTSELSSLKRFKDEVKEVVNGQDCGIGIAGYNDIKVGDQIEAFVEVEIKRTLG